MKKTVSLLLALAMTLALCCPAFAASQVTFSLTCDGAEERTRSDGTVQNVIEGVSVGDKITVYYTVSAASDVTAITQNEIYYNHDYFTLDEESVTKESAFSDYAAKPQTRIGDRHFVFFNCENEHSYGAEQQIGSFTLTVKAGASGASVISSMNCGAASGTNKYPVTTNNLWVGFGDKEWDGMTFTVTLNAADGTLPSGVGRELSVNSFTGQKLKLQAPTRKFYTFAGWKADNGDEYEAGKEYTISSDLTLTAQWTAVPAPAAPTGLGTVKASVAGAADGKITNVTTAMEYTASQQSMPIACTGTTIGGLKAGTYYVRLKADPAANTPAGEYAEVIVPDGPGASSGGGGNSGGTPTAGSKSSDLTVKATVSADAVATVSAASDADIKAAAASESGLIGIDLSREKEPVEAAKLPSGMIGKIAGAVKGNDKGGFALKLTSANLEFDAKALQSLADQAKSGDLQINMRDTGTMALNNAQYEAVKGMSLYGGYNVTAEVGDKSISQFSGGNIRISIPLNIPNGHYAEGFCAYYVAPDGKLTRLATTYQDGMINFSVNHFSDYIIAYSEDNIGKTAFVDLVPGEYYQDAVAWAVSNGITTGTSATTFSPDAGTTRAQVVTFLWRAAGSPEPKGDAGKFTDLLAGEYYVKAVAWAVEQGVTNGMTDTTFAPDATCTRAQIVTFLWRAMGSPEPKGDAGKFTDLLTGEYYVKPVAWAVEQGITSGTTPTTFSPDATCTRAQVVTFLWRSMK